MPHSLPPRTLLSYVIRSMHYGVYGSRQAATLRMRVQHWVRFRTWSVSAADRLWQCSVSLPSQLPTDMNFLERVGDVPIESRMFSAPPVKEGPAVLHLYPRCSGALCGLRHTATATQLRRTAALVLMSASCRHSCVPRWRWRPMATLSFLAYVGQATPRVHGSCTWDTRAMARGFVCWYCRLHQVHEAGQLRHPDGGRGYEQPRLGRGSHHGAASVSFTPRSGTGRPRKTGPRSTCSADSSATLTSASSAKPTRTDGSPDVSSISVGDSAKESGFMFDCGCLFSHSCALSRASLVSGHPVFHLPSASRSVESVTTTHRMNRAHAF